MKIITLLSLSIIVFYSCHNKKRENLQYELALLQSQEIKLSLDKMQHLMNGKDTLMTDFTDSELKLVVYSDSSACSSCVIQKMYLWDHFIKNTAKYGGRLKFYFLFSPANEEGLAEVNISLRINAFNYPVFIDGGGVFAKENPHLPKSPKLHSFLLDKENKIILVGSPLHSAKIGKMFYKLVEDELGEK